MCVYIYIYMTQTNSNQTQSSRSEGWWLQVVLTGARMMPTGPASFIEVHTAAFLHRYSV